MLGKPVNAGAVPATVSLTNRHYATDCKDREGVGEGEGKPGDRSLLCVSAQSEFGY